jgi:RNA polymerase sigma-70 factor, ECF subfamily
LSDIEAMERFTALYDQFNRQVYGYAVTRAGRQSADEIVGDTFLVAWRRFGELPEEPLPWLLGVARNRIRDQARQTARRSSVEQELNPWIGADEQHEQPGADPAELVTDRVGVLAALATLGADDRELLTLVAWHGLTPAAAAEVIGCSPATYSVRLHRARKRLEQALRDQNDTVDSPAVPPVSVLRKGFSR